MTGVVCNRMAKFDSIVVKIAFGVAVFAVLATAILTRPPKWLTHFDQSFYLTIAYDLNHHGEFSNGVFDNVDHGAAPPPGMFFAPLYPWLVAAASKLDPRFARAVDCAVEANRHIRDGAECEVYARPMHIIHALLLTIAVLAIGFAGELIFARRGVFWLAGALATIALLAHADLFSFVMTESLTVSLYGVMALALVASIKRPCAGAFVFLGLLLGLLCLIRTSYVALMPVVLGLIVIAGVWMSRVGRRAIMRRSLAFALAWLIVVGPWVVRNGLIVGKWNLTEEYGSATLIERFAFDDMTLREFALAFPYCLPAIGAPAVAWAFGPDAIQRFLYDTPGSFFEVGRLHRDELVAAHGRLDPVIATVIRDEMRARAWRYLLVSAPLAWCGLWVGGVLGLALVPLFAWACVAAVRWSQPLFLIYATPALMMLALHAALANHYSRYNLILIGPFSVSAAWIIARVASALAKPAIAIPAPRRRS
jgi:hypothetical protein